MMKLTNQRTSAERRGARPTKAAGWIAIAFGIVHLVVASLENPTRGRLSDAASDGWWNTFTLDASTTLAEFERSQTFWVTLGSFGVPVLVLGCWVVWSTHQRQRVPGWIGWVVLAWGLLIVSAVPASPGWALCVSGGLIALGDMPARR